MYRKEVTKISCASRLGEYCFDENKRQWKRCRYTSLFIFASFVEEIDSKALKNVLFSIDISIPFEQETELY